jgi:hypothetical protein
MQHEWKILRFALLFAAVAVVIPVRAETPDLFEKMVSGGNARVQLDAANEITANRNKTIQSLLQVAQTSNVTTGKLYFAKQLAIDTLGDYRAEQAVGFLISNISFEESYPTKSGLSGPYVDGLPCVLSLIQIGRPSIEGIMQRLEKPATVRELSLFGFVIHQIDGEKIASFRLESALKEIEARQNKPAGMSEGDWIKLANLRRLIEIYRDEGWYKPKYLNDQSSPAPALPK